MHADMSRPGDRPPAAWPAGRGDERPSLRRHVVCTWAIFLLPMGTGPCEAGQRSEGRNGVAPRRVRELLVSQALEVLADALAGSGRLQDVVDETSLGR